MSRAFRLRTVPWVLGVLLLGGSLAGARLLNPTENRQVEGVDADANPASRYDAKRHGTIVLGTVDSDPPPVAIGPPALAAMATVEAVPVREGQEVQPGDLLVQFDDRIYQTKLAQAKAELQAAEQELNKAQAQIRAHNITVERQKAAIRLVEEEITEARNVYTIARDKLESILRTEKNFSTGQALSDAEKERRRREDLDLRKVAFTLVQLQAKLEDEQKKLELLQQSPIHEDEQMAKAKIERLKATVREAEVAIETCVVRVKEGAAGVVEQLHAAPGMTYGPSTRSPLALIVPKQRRVVRAEVEPEFAYKISDRIGSEVTIYDHNNFDLTYPGVVRRIGTAFLPKRGSNDLITMNPSRVLECLIEVTDPTPQGKPPLRVGQPVRVRFP